MSADPPSSVGLDVGAVASIAAGAIHAAAAGVHVEHPQLARLFVLVAVVQMGAGFVALVRPNRSVGAGVAIVNTVAVGAWLATRVSGISFIAGLQLREPPRFADTVCAAFGICALVGGAVAALIGGNTQRVRRLAVPSLAAAVLAVPAMFVGGSTVDDHQVTAASGDLGHGAHAAEQSTADTLPPPDHPHGETTLAVVDGAEPWPRRWDPTQPIDVSGVEGVSAEQEARAVALIEGSLQQLPKFANVDDAVAAGYSSIGDSNTGSEHFINVGYVVDDALLDPTKPESLVYTVDGDTRTLAGAMYIASARPIDDPSLTEWAGPLMEWHNHGDLCWEGGKVVGVVDDNGACAEGSQRGGEFPMVHVWITPHPCGVFAALEGVGAGQAAVPDSERADMCAAHGHDDQPTTTPYDPALPIDLGGIDGVTPEQQAAAENIVAENVMRLGQWADYRDAEAAGFHSIGDGFSGIEHFVKWDWISDDVWLDPDAPESLVYRVAEDGTKTLVSAMYMLPPDIALDDVPDIGGRLMQWHIHGDLCFTPSDAPQVAGIVDELGECPDGLQKFPPSAMIHVWITPHPCGPFAALEGLAAGQVAEGETQLCDHAHGSTG